MARIQPTAPNAPAEHQLLTVTLSAGFGPGWTAFSDRTRTVPALESVLGVRLSEKHRAFLRASQGAILAALEPYPASGKGYLLSLAAHTAYGTGFPDSDKMSQAGRTRANKMAIPVLAS